MKPLSPEAQRLLSRYKSTQSLPSEEKSQLLGVIQQRLLRGDLPQVASQPAPPFAPAESTWASPWAKLGLGVVLLSLPAAALLTLDRQAPPPAPVAHHAPPTERSVATPPPLPVVPVPSASAPAAVEPPQRVRSQPGASSASEPTIDEEMRLLNGAQAALRGSDPQRALRLLSEHSGRFPAGKLSRARDVTRMLALCQAGRGEQARTEADRFLAQHPASPFADRVKKICVQP